jgi:glycine cleavage system aminomethyltransferase T
MSGAITAVYRGPGGEGPAPRDPVMRSAVHRAHAAMGGTFEVRAGWDVPALYGTDKDEVAALNSTLGFADVSARGKVHLSGAVDGFIQKLAGSTVAPLRTSPVKSGGTVARIARDWALALVPAQTESALIDELDGNATDAAMATDVTSAWTSFLVAGPRLEDFLARSLTLDLAELRAGTCAAATWSRIPAVLVVRDLAAPAVEIHVGSDHGRYAWETIRRLAGHLGGSPVGWRALDSWGWQ